MSKAPITTNPTSEELHDDTTSLGPVDATSLSDSTVISKDLPLCKYSYNISIYSFSTCINI